MVKSFLKLRRGFWAIAVFLAFLFMISILYIAFYPLIQKSIEKSVAAGAPASGFAKLQVTWQYFPLYAIIGFALWAIAASMVREFLGG